MKKLILLLLLIPFACSAKITCPPMQKLRVVCKRDQVTIVKHLTNVQTSYHTAFPECRISDSRMVDSKGDFKLNYIFQHICGIDNYKDAVRIHFSTGINWFFGLWTAALPRLWVYTPE